MRYLGKNFQNTTPSSTAPLAERRLRISENRFKWHKYPEEKPKKDDDYLVSVKIENESFTLTSCFDTLIDAFGILSDKYVTAWAEMPEPYKEEKGNEEKKYLQQGIHGQV